MRVAASNPSSIFSPHIQQAKAHQFRGFSNRLSVVVRNPRTQLCFSNTHLEFRGLTGHKGSIFRCNSSSGGGRPDAPGSGENENRTVLDAFFLGKALAEVVNERIESTIGEVLGAIGRLQAEQQKQVQEIQEEVLERAKRAKEKAAREALEAQGLVSKPAVANSTSVTSIVASDAVAQANPPSLSQQSSNGTERDPGPADEETVLGVSDDE